MHDTIWIPDSTGAIPGNGMVESYEHSRGGYAGWQAATIVINSIDRYNTAMMTGKCGEQLQQRFVLATNEEVRPDGVTPDIISIRTTTVVPTAKQWAASARVLNAMKRLQAKAMTNPMSGDVAWQLSTATDLKVQRAIVQAAKDPIRVMNLMNEGWGSSFVTMQAIDVFRCNLCDSLVWAEVFETHALWPHTKHHPREVVDGFKRFGSKHALVAAVVINKLGIKPAFMHPGHNAISQALWEPDLAAAVNTFNSLASDEWLYAGLTLEDFILDSLGEARVKDLARTQQVR